MFSRNVVVIHGVAACPVDGGVIQSVLGKLREYGGSAERCWLRPPPFPAARPAAVPPGLPSGAPPRLRRRRAPRLTGARSLPPAAAPAQPQPTSRSTALCRAAGRSGAAAAACGAARQRRGRRGVKSTLNFLSAQRAEFQCVLRIARSAGIGAGDQSSADDQRHHADCERIVRRCRNQHIAVYSEAFHDR